MNTIDLGGLIKGLMGVMGIAFSLGQLPALKRWAAHETFGASHSHIRVTAESRRNRVGKPPENTRNRPVQNYPRFSDLNH